MGVAKRLTLAMILWLAFLLFSAYQLGQEIRDTLYPVEEWTFTTLK